MKPSIETSKLEDYVRGNNSYYLYREGGKIELHFSPEFPEAIAHLPEGEPVEHIMYGYEEGGRIYFTSFTTKSSFGETTTDLDGEDANILGQMRTGALPAMVTSLLLKQRSVNFSIFGSGFRTRLGTVGQVSASEVYMVMIWKHIRREKRCPGCCYCGNHV